VRNPLPTQHDRDKNQECVEAYLFEEQQDQNYQGGYVISNSSNSLDMASSIKRLGCSSTKKSSEATLGSGARIEANADGRCHLCPSTFKSRIQLLKHIKRSHSGKF